MTETLLVSNLLLWILVLALLGVVLALLRQVGVLHERVAPAGALVARGGPAVGEAAPQLRVQDWSGTLVSVGGPDPDGAATLLLFVSARCPVCSALLPALDSLVRGERGRLRALLASDGPRAEHEAFAADHGLGLPGTPYVLSAELGMAFRVASVPFAVLIDPEGVVRAQGLVNSREHLESLLEARARGVASLQEYLARTPDARRAAS